MARHPAGDRVDGELDVDARAQEQVHELADRVWAWATAIP